MMSAMTRRSPARVLGLVLLVCLLPGFLLVASLFAEEPPVDPRAGAAPAASAFEAAYARFESDFDDAAALAAAADATLVERTAAIRAVRLAFSEFDTTVSGIAMPPGAAADAAAMHAAIEDLIVKFDLQGATTTVSAYQEANPAAAAAYDAARAAISTLRSTLATLGRPTSGPSATAVALPSPGSQQSPIGPEVTYLSDGRVTGPSKWRDALLDIAVQNVDLRYVDNESRGIRAAWVAAFPDLLTDGALVRAQAEAPRNGISGVVVRLPDPTREPARDNAPYLAFAVRGDGGTCVGGVISGYPAMTTTTPVGIPPAQVCTGLAVAAAAGFGER